MEEMSQEALKMIGCERCASDPMGETKVAYIEGATVELMRLHAMQYAQKMKFWNLISGQVGQFLDRWDFLERWLFPRRFVTPEEFQAVFRESIPQGVTYSPAEVRRLQAKYPIYSLAGIKNEEQRRQFTLTFENSDKGYLAFMQERSPTLHHFFFS